MIKLKYHPPYNLQSILDFLNTRATPGVEKVTGSSYLRSIEIEGQQAVIEVRQDEDTKALTCQATGVDKKHQPILIQRLNHLFDLNADPRVISSSLKRDKKLWNLAKK